MNQGQDSPSARKTVDVQTDQPLMGSVKNNDLTNNCREKGGKAQLSLPSLNQPFVEGSIKTSVGTVARISSTLVRADRWGSIKARWGVGRTQRKRSQ